MLTTENFAELFPNCEDPEGWVTAMNTAFPKYGIDTPRRIASFVAQCGHESGGWRTFSENLNYSAKALDAIFGKYFKRAGRDAQDYHRQPEKIANVVYANRMDNGDTDSGNGYRYRGRGPIQLTGKANYLAFSKWIDMACVSNPHWVTENKDIALASAIWYWDTNNLNKYADNDDIKTMTKRINGGYIGLEDRIHHYQAALTMMGVFVVDGNTAWESGEETSDEAYSTLRRGMKGDGVKEMQEALGLNADGIFGRGTERALVRWQEANGLTADGIAGPQTLNTLMG